MKAEGDYKRNKELGALKRQAKDMETRLHALEKRIVRLEAGRPPSTFRPPLTFHSPLIFRSKLVFRAVVDSRHCVGCGTCQDVCPTGAISMEQIARVDSARCIGCGRCAEVCPQGAVRLHPVNQEREQKARAVL